MSIARNIKRALANWNNYNRTVRELSSLDSRSLADLGITRADIHEVARTRIY